MELLALARELDDCLPVHELSDDALAKLLLHAKVGQFDRGEIVYRTGDPAVDLHVIVDGSVKLIREEDDGREVLLWSLVRGGIFGQQAVFGRPRPSTAIAMIDTRTIQVPGTACAEMLEDNPRIMYRAFEMIERRVERLTQSLEDVMVLDVRGRIAKYLVDNARASGASHALTFTQDDLAAAVGSTRVTVNKVLAGFEHRGLVRLGRRQIDVLSVDGLRAEVRG